MALAVRRTGIMRATDRLAAKRRGSAMAGKTGLKPWRLEQDKNTGIALNVTRTRVTVLVFNLTIISLMLSMIGST